MLSLDIEIVNFVVLSFVPLFPLLGLRSVRGITRMRIFSDMLRFWHICIWYVVEPNYGFYATGRESELVLI